MSPGASANVPVPGMSVWSRPLVHVELDWVRMQLKTHNLFHFQFDISVDLIVIEYAALLQEVAVRVQSVERFTQRSADLWDRRCFFRWQVVQVFVHRVAWVDLVLDPVEARHEQGCEGQVWVGGWIWEACFNTLRFFAASEWNTDRSRPVTRRVSEHNRCFEARHQTLIRVCRGVGQSVQCASVLNDTANGGKFRQTRIKVADEVGLPPDQIDWCACMQTVIVEVRLRHKGRRFAIARRNIVDHVLIELEVVRRTDQCVELCQLVLGRRHRGVLFWLKASSPMTTAFQSAYPAQNRQVGQEVTAFWTWAAPILPSHTCGVRRQLCGVEAVARDMNSVFQRTSSNTKIQLLGEIGRVTNTSD